jgi:hypothetical protein
VNLVKAAEAGYTGSIVEALDFEWVLNRAADWGDTLHGNKERAPHSAGPACRAKP